MEKTPTGNAILRHQLLLCDGHVQMIAETINVGVYNTLCTRQSGGRSAVTRRVVENGPISAVSWARAVCALEHVCWSGRERRPPSKPGKR